jgi:hypothetical protein
MYICYKIENLLYIHLTYLRYLQFFSDSNSMTSYIKIIFPEEQVNTCLLILVKKQKKKGKKSVVQHGSERIYKKYVPFVNNSHQFLISTALNDPSRVESSLCSAH